MADVKMVMQASHKVAKHLVGRTGNYQIAFTFALRQVWNVAKHLDRQNARLAARGSNRIIAPSADYYVKNAITKLLEGSKAEYIFDVPAWIIRKNAALPSRLISGAVAAETVKETEKAVEIKFTIDGIWDDINEPMYLWVPKSVMAK